MTQPAGWIETRAAMPWPGARAQRCCIVSMRDTTDVAGIGGDRNPLHADAAFARTSRLGGLIVQDEVTSGLRSAAVVADLLVPGAVLLSVHWALLKAAALGDTPVDWARC
jgi:acyl dehydratase